MREKFAYSIAMLLMMVLGFGSRAFADQLPLFISRHFGDALWAAMIYFAFRVLLTRQQRWISVVLSFGFSFGIEFSQLYQEIWINELRATLLGGLILGKGFLWIDLIRYSAGILFSYVADRFGFARIRAKRKG
ncbi:ribosomal maturation YjgA family protein [Paenibacillus sp. FSL M7-1046]|uniref:ribosomal maturation YjgA family protein n=1 Tax=Paenibacillus sp. FSL M7-1046 TaxID=2975315 RepID=UPI0030F4C4A8